MKKLLFAFVALTLVSCSNNGDSTTQKTTAAPQTQVQQNAASQPKEIFASYTPAQAMSLIQQRKDLLIVDVRSPQELNQGKIQNSVLVPFWNVMKGEHSLPKDRPLLLVCAVGGRSYGAMQILARQGYKELYNLKGGMSAWVQEKMPVVY